MTTKEKVVEAVKRRYEAGERKALGDLLFLHVSEIRELAKTGISKKRIAEMIGERIGVRINPDSFRKWCRRHITA